MSTIILIAVAYILGSVPNALWIGKVFKGIDIREHGSKNTGSTNAARVLGAKLGILTLILDISKGAIPVALSLFMKADLLENITGISNLDFIMIGIFAIIGHSFSIFMKFKGGKAVATTVGVFTVLVPKALLLSGGIFCNICIDKVCFSFFNNSRNIIANIYFLSLWGYSLYSFWRNNYNTYNCKT